VFSPKSFLRHKKASSSLEECAKGSFHKVLVQSCGKESSRRIVLCTGKIYYDLLDMQEKNNIDNITLVRLEQLYPFPYKELEKALKNSKESAIVWCQEEPKNQGAWSHVSPLLRELLGIDAQYIGPLERSSPALGYAHRHQKEQTAILRKALLGEKD
jgi:2-oxoglutarate dehydrogenase E1 component